MSEEGVAMRSERGQATVELAVVLPFLLLVLLGIAELGMMLSAYLSVQTLAQRGAEDVGLGMSETAIVAQLDGLVPPDLNPAAVTIAFSPDESQGNWGFGTPVTVTVRYPYPVVAPLISSLVGSQVYLESSLTEPAG